MLRILKLALLQYCKISSCVRDKVSPGSKAAHPSGIAVSGFLLCGLLTGAMESEWYLLQQHTFTSYIAPLYPELRAFKKKWLSLSLVQSEMPQVT